MSGRESRPDPRSGQDPAGGNARGVSLPPEIAACLFDLDGVLTRTARLHDEAWKQMFDAFLRERAEQAGEPFRPFDKDGDYKEFVDGKPRYDGVRSFLSSRGIRLPEGDPSDPASAESVAGLGNRKNELVLQLMRERGVQTYPGAIDLVRAVRAQGLGTAVVSGSANCESVLHAAGIETLFDARVDGRVLSEMHLRGKPAPDSYLAAARMLGVSPGQAAVFEDAPSGIAAARAGRFGFVVAVDRTGRADELRAEDPDVIVSELSELLS
jgi:beta-phosphoglucomutase family hydrolase